MLVGDVGNRASFILLGALTLAAFWRVGRGAARRADAVIAPADGVSLYVSGAVAAFYTVLYLINAAGAGVGAGCTRVSPGIDG